MRKSLGVVAALLTLGLALSVAGVMPPARAENAGSDAVWTFQIPLSLCQSEYALLVNRDHLLSADFVPDDLVRVEARTASSSSVLMRNVAAAALLQMFEDAAAQGVNLYVDNGYRSYSRQHTMYENRKAANGGKDDGVVAYPGSSDHQTGLGADIISKAWIGKRFTEDFAETNEAKWMAEYCCDYGFIIRYPKDATITTGIIYEPWHLRYVGKLVARYIFRNNLTLEDFYAQWQTALDAFVAAGGDVEKALQDEWDAANRLPTPVELEVFGTDGDVEISIAF